LIYEKYKRYINYLILVFFTVHLSAVSFSIAISSVSFGIWGGLWIIDSIAGRRNPFKNNATKELKYVYIFLLIYIIFEILSRLFAVIPEGALSGLKRILLLMIFTAGIDKIDSYFKLEKIITAVLIIFSAVSSYEVIRYFIELFSAGFNIDILNSRLCYFAYPITTAEIKMLIFLLVFPLLFMKNKDFRKKKIIVSLLLIPILISIFLTFSRNVYLGIAVAIFLTGIVISRKTLIAVTILLLLLYFFSPGQVKERINSIFDPNHPNNYPRLVMWQTGITIFRDYPLTGTGDNEITEVYKMYKEPVYHGEGSHFHNNFIMILVTTGIFGFAGYCGFLITLLLKQIRIYRICENEYLKKLSFGSILGFISFNIAGIFEWNFGDWEVLSVFLFIISIPFIIFNIENLKTK